MVSDEVITNWFQFKDSLTFEVGEEKKIVISTEYVIRMLNIIADLLLEMKEQKI